MLDIHIDTAASTPPYEQVRTQIADRVVDGRLPAGTKLPTVRRLASDLGLAVNTVARAYRELETDGLLVTEGRRGTFVSSSTTPATRAEVARSAAAYVAEARRHGLTRAEATRLVEDSWTR